LNRSSNAFIAMSPRTRGRRSGLGTRG